MTSILNAKSIRLYPNPAEEKLLFAVELEQAGIVEIHIYNYAGESIALIKEALPAGSATLAWRCGSVSPGIYLAEVHCGTTVKKLKIAVVR